MENILTNLEQHRREIRNLTRGRIKLEHAKDRISDKMGGICASIKILMYCVIK